MATPPPPESGAEIDSFVIDDVAVDNNGEVTIAVDQFADPNNPNDVTITNTSTDPVTLLTIEKMGGNEGAKDVIRIDLSQFDDDFTIVLKNTGDTVQDQLFLEGLQSYTDNGDGTFTGTYYGTDGQLHTIEIQPENAAVTPYYAPDGIITGEEGAETMGVGYTDLQGDEIDGADGDDDVIIGGGGRDTITAGAGNDTIYGDYEQIGGGSSIGMPPNAYTGTPAGPDAGAEVFAFSITDTNLDANGRVILKVDSITPNKALAQDFTITDDALTEGVTLIQIEKGGGNDGSADIYRIDLSGFNDDFTVTIADEDAVDRLVFENVHSISTNADGTYQLTYYGEDNALHEVTVDNDLAQVDFFLSPDSPYFYDDYIDAGTGDDFVDGGLGDDTILGGDGADTLGGGDGSDTIDGGAGNDVIEGDRTGPSQALADTLQYSYAQNSAGDQATHFGEQGTGGADDPLNFIDGDVETEVRYHQDDIIEYAFGQEVPAGTSITLIEGPNGVDDGIVNVYVSFGSTDPNGDTLSGGGGGVGYENAITNGEAVLIYSGPSDSTIDLEIPINATHIQFVGIESHGGWAEIEFTELMNPLDAGDDVITGGDGDDIIDGGGGNDTIDGGADNDSILGGLGDDSLDGGSGSDNIDGGEGADQIDGGTGDDDLDGGLGDDTVLGGDGADTITGGESRAEIPLERVAFEWSAIPDPDDGGQIDNLDQITSGTQDVNGVTVDYAFTTADVSFADTGVYSGGIDAGSGTVNSSSALSIDDEVTIDFGFSEPVSNVSFNIADLEASAEIITIYVFDADGNPIPFNVTEGATVTGSDTDGVAGNDQFVGTVDPVGDTSSSGAIEVNIPGPVGSIQIVMTSPGAGSLVMSDIYFDEPGTGIAATGNDLLEGGADEDTFVVLDDFGQDTIIGGETITTGTNYDTIDLSGTTVPLTVTFDGDKSGTITDGTNTITFSEIERLILGPESDVVDASADTIGTEIIAGAGDDSVLGGSGNDSVDGGTGNDTISGGAGNDDLDGGAGDDTLFGGEGEDTLTAGNNTGAGDVLYGGAGNDTLNDSFWNATLDGGADADVFSLGFGTATVTGGETGDDLDTMSFATADDTVDITFDGDESGTYADDDGDSGTFSEIEAFELTSGNDSLDGTASSSSISVDGGAGNDTLTGGAGNDSIDGGTGDDTLKGGTGADELYAGTGNDNITFSEGDQVYGGSGDDTFTLEDLGELSNGTITIDGGAGSETGGDTLQLGSLGVLTQSVRDTFVDDGSGSFSGSITLDDGSILNFSEIENIICFTPLTRIATPRGLVAVEDLNVGDLVVTRDHGLQAIRWIESRTVPAMDRFAPVRIRRNVLIGQNRDLIVSPQHRVLFQGYRAELLFGEREVLVAAKHLIDGMDVTQDESNHVTYVHILFDRHEIIYAEGAATESFHPGDIGFSAVSDEAREELFAIFPKLRSDPNQYGSTARRCLKSFEATLIS